MPSRNLKQVIADMHRHTDCWPWYWLSYGEKCYAFATVCALPADDGGDVPKPGTKLLCPTRPTRENGLVKMEPTCLSMTGSAQSKNRAETPSASSSPWRMRSWSSRRSVSRESFMDSAYQEPDEVL